METRKEESESIKCRELGHEGELERRIERIKCSKASKDPRVREGNGKGLENGMNGLGLGRVGGNCFKSCFKVVQRNPECGRDSGNRKHESNHEQTVP